MAHSDAFIAVAIDTIFNVNTARPNNTSLEKTQSCTKVNFIALT